MRFTKNMKKTLSMLLAAAMVVTGVNVTTGKAEAAGATLSWTGQADMKTSGSTIEPDADVDFELSYLFQAVASPNNKNMDLSSFTNPCVTFVTSEAPVDGAEFKFCEGSSWSEAEAIDSDKAALNAGYPNKEVTKLTFKIKNNAEKEYYVSIQNRVIYGMYFHEADVDPLSSSTETQAPIETEAPAGTPTQGAVATQEPAGTPTQGAVATQEPTEAPTQNPGNTQAPGTNVPTTPASQNSVTTPGGVTTPGAVGTKAIKFGKKKTTTIVVAPNKSKTVKFTATVAAPATQKAVVTASIAKKSVVSKAVVSDGKVKITAAKKAVRGASTKVTLQSKNAEGKTVSAKITVKIQNKAKKVKAAKKSITIKKGKKAKVTLKVTAQNKKKATTDAVKVSSKVVKLAGSSAKKGKVVVTLKAKKKGSQKVTIKVGSKKAVVKVKVK